MTDTVTTRLTRWENRAEIPLLLLALAFLVAYAWPVLDPNLDRDLRTYLSLLSWAVWGVFAFDFAVRLSLTQERLRYAVRHWFDVVMILVPLLRPLRLLRLLAAMRMLNRAATHSLLGRVGIYVGGTSVLCILLGALAVLDTEQHHPDANITTIGDALWWAVVTSFTVGYGDYYPITATGRLIAVGLMLVGIAIIGSVTAGVAAWLVSAVERESTEAE